MLPTFIVIGAMKGGTSSLYQYLAAHPEICMSSVKETDFFVAEKNLSRGRGWYESLFQPSLRGAKGPRQLGEASPNYSKWPQFRGVPERMHALLPSVRLIYMVRDPIARIVSHYAHNISAHSESRPIDQAVAADADNVYLAPSQYRTQLEEFLRYYPLERILVLSSEELRDQRRQAIGRVYEFLGVDPTFESSTFEVEYHDTAGKFRRVFKAPWPTRMLAKVGLARIEPPPLPPSELAEETRSQLIDALRPEIDGLRRLTGQRFEGWSV